MLIYEVLATLWASPATDIDVAAAIADRSGSPCSRNLAEQHLRLLRTTGFVKTHNANGTPLYMLTDSGSALLSQLADSQFAEV